MAPGSGLRPDFNLDIKSPLPGLSGISIPGLGAEPFILDPIVAKMRSKLDEGQEVSCDTDILIAIYLFPNCEYRQILIFWNRL
jgi:hypothetical protein